MAAVFDGWANDTYTEFNTTINLNTGEEEVCDTLLFRKATEEERKQFIKKVGIRLKGQVQPRDAASKACPFKPFDKVLVRDFEDCSWKVGLFSHYKKGDKNPYVCVGSLYKQCIPYEGNENLLGTTDPYTEGDKE